MDAPFHGACAPPHRGCTEEGAEYGDAYAEERQIGTAAEERGGLGGQYDCGHRKECTGDLASSQTLAQEERGHDCRKNGVGIVDYGGIGKRQPRQREEEAAQRCETEQSPQGKQRPVFPQSDRFAHPTMYGRPTEMC